MAMTRLSMPNRGYQTINTVMKVLIIKPVRLPKSVISLVHSISRFLILTTQQTIKMPGLGSHSNGSLRPLHLTHTTWQRPYCSDHPLAQPSRQSRFRLSHNLHQRMHLARLTPRSPIPEQPLDNRQRKHYHHRPQYSS